MLALELHAERSQTAWQAKSKSKLSEGALITDHGANALRAPQTKVWKIIKKKKKSLKKKGQRKKNNGCRGSDNNIVGWSAMGLSSPGGCGATETTPSGQGKAGQQQVGWKQSFN